MFQREMLIMACGFSSYQTSSQAPYKSVPHTSLQEMQEQLIISCSLHNLSLILISLSKSDSECFKIQKSESNLKEQEDSVEVDNLVKKVISVISTIHFEKFFDVTNFQKLGLKKLLKEYLFFQELLSELYTK